MSLFFIAGVGFSYSDNSADYHVGDDRTADDNRKAISAFLVKFPQFNASDFYITSESYGGHVNTKINDASNKVNLCEIITCLFVFVVL
jgi:carboxypeptidase C (cathepsin A)